MDSHPSNPAANVLGAGVSEDDLLKAIETSGYPLQSVAVDCILRGLSALTNDLSGEQTPTARHRTHLQEEWSYFDSDTGELRSLDALISFEITPVRGKLEEFLPVKPEHTLRHHIDFLVECKQSELPFVFYLRRSPPGNVPNLVGFPHADIVEYSISESDFSVSSSLYDALGLFDLPLATLPDTAISMNRVYRKGGTGGKLELSGEEAYRSLTLPLIKALEYYSSLLGKDLSKRLYYDLRSVVPLVVLKAPMVGVHMDGETPRMESRPWVRLVRVDPSDDQWRGFSRPRFIDVVHIDYLDSYVSVAGSSASESMCRINQFSVPVLTGEANFDDSEERPEVDDDRPYLAMTQRVTDEEFMRSWRERFRTMHE